MPLLEMKDIKQTREGRNTLNGVNLGVERGEVLALIGPTGAGKTTLLRIVNLLDAPSGGQLCFDGVDITSTKKHRLASRRRMAFVLQKPVVFNTTVYENVAYGLKWRGLKKPLVRERVMPILESTDLTGYVNRNARTLSGGEMQRVAIARAVATGSEVLLLDEPTANLDPVSSAKIEDILSGIIRDNAITVIIATHDMGQGQRLADRIAVLMDGEIRQIGASGEIFYHPASREIAEFVGMENIIDGTVVANEEGITTIKADGATIESVEAGAPGDAVSACLRPEDITVALTRVSSSARNWLAGTVGSVVSSGPLCRVEIDCGFKLIALVTRRSADELELSGGKPVYATFKAVSVHVIRRR